MGIQIGALVTAHDDETADACAYPAQFQAGRRMRKSFWRPTALNVVLAAKRYEIAHNGPLGGVALEILELLANTVDFKSGRFDSSIDYMKRKLRRSRDTIMRALAALRSHGFVDWLRRFVPAESASDKAPRSSRPAMSIASSCRRPPVTALALTAQSPLPPTITPKRRRRIGKHKAI